MAGRIFINYRRGESLMQAQYLATVLVRRFGAERIYLDVRGLDGGANWLQNLERQVAASAAMVVLIGKGWVDVADEQGNRRLDDPNDFVRFEIAQALARGIPVLPVLLDGTAMPKAQRLPDNLWPVTLSQAMPLRAESFETDAEAVGRRLKSLLAERRSGRVPVWTAGAGLAAALAAGIVSGPLTLAELGLPLFGLPDETQAERRVVAAERAAQASELARRAAADRLAAAEKARDGLNEALGKAQAEAAAARKEAGDAKAELTGQQRQAATLADQLRRERDEAREASEKAAAKIAELEKRPAAATPQRTTPASPFRDCPHCPEMVVVPAGSVTMGSPENEPARYRDEGPQHRVTFARPFAVGKFSVTFDEWDACVTGGGCNGYTPSDQGWGRGRRPVIDVSWDDATGYVAWLSRTTGKDYRLLSEAEREYVTRAGTVTPFWWGSSISPAQANYNGNTTYAGGAKDEYRARTMPVDSFAPNPWGLYQVHGNVWEWTQDCWNGSYQDAPSDGSAFTAGDCGSRVLRGGSWVNDPSVLRAAARISYQSVIRNIGVGFRVARTLTP